MKSEPFDRGPEPPDLIVELARPAMFLDGPTVFAELGGPKLPPELARAKVRPLIELGPGRVDALHARAVPVSGLPEPQRLEHFVRVFTDLHPQQVEAAAGATVRRVYRRPRVGPPSLSLASLSPRDPKVVLQGYLQPPAGLLDPAAPSTSAWGVDSLAVMRRPGGQGRNARAFILEAGFDIPDGSSAWLHTDLPPGMQLAWGENLAAYRAHGLKDLGIFAAVARNDVGMRGIANRAKIVPMGLVPPGQSAVDVYTALAKTLKIASPGDVVHIAWTPYVDVQVGDATSTRAVPPQVDPAVRSLILLGTLAGVTVVQAAGNDCGELGQLSPVNGAFAGAFDADIGSLIVGACSPADGSHVGATGYGSPVLFFAWGAHVATLARSAYTASPSVDPSDYTAQYSGTSSASAIVSACCTVLQGMSRTRYGAPLAPLLLRHVLHQTGTPPLAGPALDNARMPNLRGAASLLGL